MSETVPTTKTSPDRSTDLITELEARGLLHQCTDLDGLREHLSDPVNHPRRGYAGFDPTSDSLTIGNLVPLMLLARFKQAGHIPVVLMGGGTGLIGDPSGKSAERQLQTPETVAHNIDRQRPIFESVLGQVEGPDHEIVNNNDWLGALGYLDVLREIGKFFRVNQMIKRDSVRNRIESQGHGISYTEFSYMLLQAYDFLHLYTRPEYAVTVQFGGSDQWGNILEGKNLIRRKQFQPYWASFQSLLEQIDRKDLLSSHDSATKCWRDLDTALFSGEVTEEILVRCNNFTKESERSLADAFSNWIANVKQMITVEPAQAFGLTVPLVTKADGTKFGKTESGAVWLTKERTSVYQYFQFWLNTADADVDHFLKTFTFLPTAEIDALMAEHAAVPGKRAAQRRLAREATAILHGSEAAANAERAGQALFSGDIASLDEQTLSEVLGEAPSSDLDRARLAGDDAGEGVALLDLLVETGVAKSKREAREFLQSGSVSINGTKITGPDAVDARLTADALLHGRIAAIRRGKKTWHVTRWA